MAMPERDGDNDESLKRTIKLDDYEQHIIVRALRFYEAQQMAELNEMVEVASANPSGEDDWRNDPDLHSAEEWLERTTQLRKRAKKEFDTRR